MRKKGKVNEKRKKVNKQYTMGMREAHLITPFL
jgi:hypothetical protein